jgi:hypothetical protein
MDVARRFLNVVYVIGPRRPNRRFATPYSSERKTSMRPPITYSRRFLARMEIFYAPTVPIRVNEFSNFQGHGMRNEIRHLSSRSGMV